MQELGKVLRIPYDPDPLPETPTAVTVEDWLEACRMVTDAGYTCQRDPNEAYLHFRGWRANYEALAFAIAAEIDAVPAPWSGPRTPPLPVVYPDRQPNRRPG